MSRLTRYALMVLLIWLAATVLCYAIGLRLAFHAELASYAALAARATLYDLLGLGDTVIDRHGLSAHAVRAALAPYLNGTLRHLGETALLTGGGLTVTLLWLRWLILKPKNADAFRRGGRIISARQLQRRVQGWWPRPAPVPLLQLGGVSLPRALETKHLLISGTTGAGKSTAFLHLLRTLRARGERAIITDPGGEFLARFYQDGDLILNPFDVRAVGWNLFNEVRRDFEPERFAQSVIPEGEGSAKEWHLYAQKLLANVMRRLIERGDMSMASLAEWLTEKPLEELGILLTGLEMQQLAHSGNERMAANTRAICGVYLSVFRYICPGGFSIRDWMHAGQGWIFVPYSDSQFGVLKQLISTWMDIAVSAGLDLPPDPDRRIWFLLDELDSLQQLPSLIPALTRLRKHGGAVVAGVQTVSQLRQRYGADQAQTLLSCFSSRLVLKAGDEETAEQMSKELGHREVDRLEESLSLGEKSNSNSWKLNRVQERLVLSTELRKLEDMHGFLDLTGPHPIARITLPPIHLPLQAPAFVERSDIRLALPIELEAPMPEEGNQSC